MCPTTAFVNEVLLAYAAAAALAAKVLLAATSSALLVGLVGLVHLLGHGLVSLILVRLVEDLLDSWVFTSTTGGQLVPQLRVCCHPDVAKDEEVLLCDVDEVGEVGLPMGVIGGGAPRLPMCLRVTEEGQLVIEKRVLLIEMLVQLIHAASGPKHSHGWVDVQGLLHDGMQLLVEAAKEETVLLLHSGGADVVGVKVGREHPEEGADVGGRAVVCELLQPQLPERLPICPRGRCGGRCSGDGGGSSCCHGRQKHRVEDCVIMLV